jgi:hypothetical protein
MSLNEQGTTVRHRTDSPWRTWEAPKAFEAGKPSLLEIEAVFNTLAQAWSSR